MMYMIITEALRIREMRRDFLAARDALRRAPPFSMIVDRRGRVYAHVVPALWPDKGGATAERRRLERLESAWRERCGASASEVSQ